MVYSDRFVLCVLVSGEPQKELANGCVPIKFGTQYSLRLRNKNSRRAVAKITIDGECVSGSGIIIPANDYVDIHRRTDKDVAFKFVELDSPEAVDAGKNGLNSDKIKGTIQVSFFLEREEPKIHYYPCYYRHPIYGIAYGSSGLSTDGIVCGSSGLSTGGLLRGSSIGSSVNDSNGPSHSVSCGGPQGLSTALKDGCTVDGDSTGQQFYAQHIDTEYQSTTVTLFLQGYAEIPQRKTKKINRQLTDLERENEELRRQLALIENERLKKAVKRKSKSI